MSKTIIVTGAAGNMGTAVRKHLVKQGFYIEAAVGPHRDPKALNDEHTFASQVNLMKEEAAAEFVKAASERHERITAAALLVGGFAMGDLQNTSETDLDKMFALNFKTAFFMVKPLMNLFKQQKQGGQIILVGTRPAITPEQATSTIAYSLTKSLIFRLAEIINVEGKEHGITASVLVPSTLDTPENREAMPDADFSSWVPLEKVGETVGFILSDAGTMLREPIFKLYNEA